MHVNMLHNWSLIVSFQSKCLSVLIMMAAAMCPVGLQASTVVQMQTDLGNIDIVLFEQFAPKTVENFLNYVSDGDYDGSCDVCTTAGFPTYIHRSIPGFIVQGGGYIFNPAAGDFFTGGVMHIAQDDPVENEAGLPGALSNVRSTMAMAKVDGDPDSATSEWFFSLTNNAANLDFQNGGFTVFGMASSSGMGTVDEIASLPRCRDYPGGDSYCNAAVPPAGTTPFVDVTASTPSIQPENLVKLFLVGLEVSGDTDNDAVTDIVEDAAPNNGDGNNDGTSDSQQSYVASIAGESGDYITIVGQQQIKLQSVFVLDDAFRLATRVGCEIAAVAFPNGVVGFNLTATMQGGPLTSGHVDILLPQGSEPDSYYLYGSTPDNDNPHWYEFMFDAATGTGAIINGNIITLHFVDGKRGDASPGTTDGVVFTAPGGPVLSDDADLDGVPDAIEDAGPNSGDANLDLMQDRLQGYVVSAADTSGRYVLLETDAELRFDNACITAELPSKDERLAGADFTSGYFTFGVGAAAGGDIASAEVTVTLPDGVAPNNYFIYGATPALAASHWDTFRFDGETGAEINGNVITLHYVDAGRGDANLDTEDGVIVAISGGPAGSTDADADGSNDVVEDAAPNAGDGNQDGIADSVQGHVVSFADLNQDYLTLATESLYAFESFADRSSVLVSNPSSNLTGLNFAYGLFGFSVKDIEVGGTLAVQLILPKDDSPFSYYQFGPTPDNPLYHWYEFMFDEASGTGAKIEGNVVTLHFVDGGRGDADLDNTNGRIIDPGAPVFSAPSTSGGGGGGGCSLRGQGGSAGQAGAWWLLLMALMLPGLLGRVGKALRLH